VPEKFHGKDFKSPVARVVTAGSGATLDIQIARYRSGWVDMLSTKLTIDSGEVSSKTAETPVVVDTSNDDLEEGDLIRIDIDSVPGTAPKGLLIYFKVG